MSHSVFSSEMYAKMKWDQIHENWDLVTFHIFRMKIDQKVFGSAAGYGTGFIVRERDEDVYLVTAAHMFTGIHINDVANSISIQHERKFFEVEVSDFRIGNCHYPETDIAVFKVNEKSLQRDLSEVPMILSPKNEVLIGIEVIFVGYPILDAQTEYFVADATSKSIPRPVLKYGYLSHFSGEKFYIDGAPNKGFSGSPVVFRDQNNSLCYLGVVSSGVNDDGQGAYTIMCGTMNTVNNFIDRIIEGN